MPKVLKITKFQNLGKKEFRHKFNFLHEDQNQNFLEADTIVFGGHDEACPKYPKQQLFAIFLQLLLNPCLTLVFSLGITLVDVLQNWLNWFHFLFLEVGLLIILIDCMIFLLPFLDVTRMSMSTVSFFAQLNSGILCLKNAFI